MRRQSVTIVGGGIAGLALAARLDPDRCAVEVIEAQPERSGAGSALVLWPAALRALNSLGVADRLRPHMALAPRQADLRRIDGTVRVTGRPPALRSLPRPPLLAALRRAVPDSVRFTTAEVHRPALLDGNLVVGADGVRSLVRELVAAPGRSQRIPTRWTALRGIASASQLGAATPPYGEAWGDGLLWGMAPVAGDRVYWFVTWGEDARPEPLDADAAVRRARERFAGAHPALQTALAGAGRAAGTLATRLWQAPPLGRYVQDRYAVIGDAAHAALPNLGRGASDALTDALSLADTLNSGGALRLWQARRLPATQATRVAAAGLMRFATGL